MLCQVATLMGTMPNSYWRKVRDQLMLICPLPLAAIVRVLLRWFLPRTPAASTLVGMMTSL